MCLLSVRDNGERVMKTLWGQTEMIFMLLRSPVLSFLDAAPRERPQS